jgi:hypothetical protein
MMNLNADPYDVTRWTKLQTKICMNVANARYHAFAVEAEWAAEFVRLGFITRAVAADYLHETAIYNQLYFEYGTDRVQAIIAAAFESIAA